MQEKIMYSRWARYYDALYAFHDYRSDAVRLTSIIRRFHPTAHTLLDVACGTGQHLRHLRESFEVEGLDANNEFLEVVHSHSPSLPVYCSKMEDLDLNKQYDVITCLFSSIGFVKTLEALQQTINNFARHLALDGLLVIEPWFSRDNFWTDRINALFVDQPNLKIAMMHATAIEDELAVIANQILVGTPQGMETMQEKHVLGLFSSQDYLEAIRRAGLNPVFTTEPAPDWKRGLHVARLE